MQFEFLPDWIYTFLILPIAVLFQRHYSNSSRITKIETTQDIYIKKVEKICDTLDLQKEEFKKMSFQMGRLDEHLSNKKSTS